MKSFHELEDDIIKSGRVLDSRDKGGEFTADLSEVSSLGRVQFRRDCCIEVQQRRLEVKHLGRETESIEGRKRLSW